jgi:exodeoxyribonuclease V alpha subunit
VIDEMSMVDLGLFEGVLKAVRGHSTLVLVGDPDQLPSVGAGAVLRDLLESGAVPAARLVEVHRQAKESGIIHGARRILKGQLPDSGENAGFSDFFRVHRDPPEQVVAALRLVMTERLPRLGFDSSTLQVLAPTKKGALGTIALNASIREWVNPGGDPIRRGGREFRVGDRVICVQNQHDLEVYNGDIGYIRSFDKKGLLIEFESRLVSWAFEDIGMLNLGYAVTVHKSQGSEYPAIILILHTVHGIMLQRTLVYTATTRAKRFCCVLGDRDAWPRALSNTTRTHRNTNLAARLSGG